MLTKIQIYGFRNIGYSQQWCSKGSTLVLGSNGAGKTSFLEAMYFLATTRSFRTSILSACCNHDTPYFSVSGEILTNKRTTLRCDWKENRKILLVNNSRATLRDYLGILSIICWSERDKGLLIGSPEARRRFLDRGIIGLDATGLKVVSRYRRLLAEKRRLLATRIAEIEVWNTLLAAEASKLIRMRFQYIEKLKRTLLEVLKQSNISSGPLEIDYRCSLRSGLSGPEEIFLELMEAVEQEKASNRPLLGPHRDDLVVSWRSHPVKALASAGELKGITLALLLAHGRLLLQHGKDPIYVFDDVDVELDQARLASFWSLVTDLKQVFITSNRPLIWKGLDLDQVWKCSGGEFTVDA